MRRLFAFCAAIACFGVAAAENPVESPADIFPDGTTISPWFSDIQPLDIQSLGPLFLVTDFGVLCDSTLVQTQAIQAVIDRAASAGGGVIAFPQGTFLSGALFFRPGTHLHLRPGAILKGSDDINDFPIVDTRIEGQSLNYFAALVNADNTDGFTISGQGTIDGNGLRYWRSFWLRRQVNPDCTNMDELRPRLVYISNSKDVSIEGVTLRNSPFWTTHIYRCERVRLSGLRIFAPAEPVKAPSSDAIDLDACREVHICGCDISVNDDAIALKGGKGPWADLDPRNGGNYDIIIERCRFGFCHSCLTFGSESIHDCNIVMRHCRVEDAARLLWLKMRPDTPQNYEYAAIEHIEGRADTFLFIHPWTQFFDLQGREDIPLSRSSHITMRNINLDCDRFFDVEQAPEQYCLEDFVFENLDIRACDTSCDTTAVERFGWRNVSLTRVDRFSSGEAE